MAKKTTQEKIREMEQKIHRMQIEKQRLVNKEKQAQKRKRDHAMIVLATSLLTHFGKEVEEYIIESDDAAIREWAAEQAAKILPPAEPQEEEKQAEQTSFFEINRGWGGGQADC